MTKWLAAYNSRDEATFLGYLSDRTQYADCDFATHVEFSSQNPEEIRAWVKSRWALADRIEVRDVVVGNPISPVAGIRFVRSNLQLAKPYEWQNKVHFRVASKDEAARRGVEVRMGTPGRWLVQAAFFADVYSGPTCGFEHQRET